MQIWSSSLLEAHGPDDMACLVADERKRDIFVASYRHSIVPRMRGATDLMMNQRHLLDYPSTAILKGPLWQNY